MSIFRIFYHLFVSSSEHYGVNKYKDIYKINNTFGSSVIYWLPDFNPFLQLVNHNKIYAKDKDPSDKVWLLSKMLTHNSINKDTIFNSI